MKAPESAAEMREMAGVRPFSVGFRAISKAIRGLKLSPEEHAAFIEMSGGVQPRDGVGFTDVQLLKPRRAGGSEAMTSELFYEAAYVPHAVMAAPGQVLVLPLVAARRDQSAELLSYARGLAGLDFLSHLVESITADQIIFNTGIALQITTADINAVSGITACGYGLSELAKFPGTDAAQSDQIIIDSLDPATLPIVGAPPRRRLRETSAFIRDGVAYEIDQSCFGREDAPTLALRGCLRLLNPNVDQSALAKEKRKLSGAVYAREYGPDFESPPEWQSSTTDSWFGSETVDKCCDEGRGILEPNPQRQYFAGIDLGVRQDGAALAIGHRERLDGEPCTVVDGVWYWPPRSASMKEIVIEAARIIRRYRARAWADQFHFDSVKDDFAREQVAITEAPWTSMGDRSKAARFGRVKFEMRDRRVRLPGADQALIKEAHNLGGKLLRSGHEQLAARKGGDDRVHAVVLMVSEALEHQPDRVASFSYWTPTEYYERKREHFTRARALMTRWPHPVFDRDGHCIDYRTMIQMAKAGTL